MTEITSFKKNKQEKPQDLLRILVLGSVKIIVSVLSFRNWYDSEMGFVIRFPILSTRGRIIPVA